MEVDLDLLTSIASGGIGTWEKSSSAPAFYRKHEDCRECLRDLQRMLRDDDPEERPAFFAASKFNFARTDLVPLITTHPDDEALLIQALKVCTLLCMPPSRDYVVQNAAATAAAAAAVRDAFLVPDALGIVVGLLEGPLAQGTRVRDADVALIQLVLTFIRNLCVIPDLRDGPSEARDASIRARHAFVQRCFEEGVTDVLTLATCAAGEHPFKAEAPLLVEIMQGLLSLAEPSALLLAPTEPPRTVPASTSGRSAVSSAGRRPTLAAATAHLPRLDTATALGRSVAQRAPARHAHSNAVFVRRHADHTRDVVLRHNHRRSELPRREGPSGWVKPGTTSTSSGTVLVPRLAAFLEEFLAEGYNEVMSTMFAGLRAGLLVSTLTQEDFQNFVRLAAYCTQYVRLKEESRLASKGADTPEATKGDGEERPTSPFAGIAATMGFENFHWVHMLWVSLTDVPANHGKQTNHADKHWDLQHASVPLLKEMLLVVDLARVAGTRHDRLVADRLQRRLLHDDQKDSGLLPVLSRLIRGYNYRFQPRSHALELVESMHIVLGIVDRLVAAESGGFRVCTKKTVALQSEGGEGANIAAPEEKAAQDATGEDTGVVGRDASPQESPKPEARGRTSVRREVAFDAERRIRQECAHPAMIHFVTWLLSGYRENSSFANHALVSFLERVSSPKSMNLEPMLYQMSVLRLFHAILADPAARTVPSLKPALALATRVTRNLMARLAPPETPDELDLDAARPETDPDKAAAEQQIKASCTSMLFVELLFWKSATVAEDVREQYNWRKLLNPAPAHAVARRRHKCGADSESEVEGPGTEPGLAGLPRRSRAGTFTEVQAKELRRAFEACNGAKDCLSRVVQALGGRFKKVHVSRQLAAMGLAKGKFTPDQDTLLAAYCEEYGGSTPDGRALIAERLNAGFSATQVKRRLQALGLVAGPPTAAGKQARDWQALLGSSSDEDGSEGEAGPGDRGSSPVGDPAVEVRPPGSVASALDAEESGIEGEGGAESGSQASAPLGHLSAAEPPEAAAASPESKRARLEGGEDVEQAAARRKAALQALRQCRLQQQVAAGEPESRASDPEPLLSAREAIQAPDKSSGRRRLKKAGAAPASLLLDASLMDEDA
ncbi:Timeless-like protein [Auxenochlorella protothecoides]|uniref:Timeless-like protein n=1 Tax=Auxenochlorella protothecoides TaxID=3075 RepID=A0A087SNA0_AUXPR|nr:Timeless-like protein [Auxenochlorella protothecoides]KFM27204.1 Timeless-like protein [Auxenochlorella protothecoides]RMZ57039.1 hypothetical protein APUTEX25_002271 [Auxenochlorella protothecoides]|eukprot:RMZ57039.1 hypothetical protein APUTEX25_002271 [Auxenochlorella protothecoides]